MEKPKKYKIVLSKDALEDIKNTKNYILETFKYREYAETGYMIESLSVYYKPYSTYLIFFVVQGETVTVIRVLKDRMYWQSIINRMKKLTDNIADESHSISSYIVAFSIPLTLKSIF